MTERTSASLLPSRQLSVVIVSVAVVLLALGGAWQWWSNSTLNPQRVFWGALQNSLSVSAVTVGQSSSSNGAQTAQLNQLNFGPNKSAESVTTFTQDDAEVQTLELSTPTADYTKYAAVKLGKAHAKAAASVADVLNIWANTTSSTPNKNPGVPATFSTVLLGLAVPVGGLTAPQQSALMDEIQTGQVYTPAFNSVQKRHQNGRLQYVYTVSMQPILYVQLMKNYAHDMGMHELDSVDPNSYRTTTLTTMQWTIDARSRQIVTISYDGHAETYSGYGVQTRPAVPTQAISGAALQQRVNALNTAIQGS